MLRKFRINKNTPYFLTYVTSSWFFGRCLAWFLFFMFFGARCLSCSANSTLLCCLGRLLSWQYVRFVLLESVLSIILEPFHHLWQFCCLCPSLLYMSCPFTILDCHVVLVSDLLSLYSLLVFLWLSVSMQFVHVIRIFFCVRLIRYNRFAMIWWKNCPCC